MTRRNAKTASLESPRTGSRKSRYRSVVRFEGRAGFVDQRRSGCEKKRIVEPGSQPGRLNSSATSNSLLVLLLLVLLRVCYVCFICMFVATSSSATSNSLVVPTSSHSPISMSA